MLDRTSPQSLQATRPKTRFAYLYVKNGLRTRCIGSNHFGEFGLNRHNQWDWIVGHLISEYGCNADDVSCVETEDGQDMIAVKGEVVGWMEEA